MERIRRGDVQKVLVSTELGPEEGVRVVFPELPIIQHGKVILGQRRSIAGKRRRTFKRLRSKVKAGDSKYL